MGAPTGEPVLVLHGTAGSGASMLNPAFAGELFGAGQPLDASRYYIVLPDAIGAGKSAKPSDGLRTAFPRYNYDDMVDAQYRLLKEHLGVKHLRVIVGNSMGGMQAWIWAQKYPGFMDAAVPMASQPTEMSSRNWMMRRLITDSIRNDPDWNGGNYTKQPRSAQFASVFFGIGTTPEQCALALTDHPGLRVMTNNLNVAMALARNPSCEITIAGGRLRNLDRDVVAAEARDFFSRFSVDIGIYGVGAVADDGTLLDFGLDEVEMRRSLAQHCRQRFLVLDHSKFGRDATVRGGHITEATAVFTDRPVPPAIAGQLKEAGIRLVVWSDDATHTAPTNGRG